MLLKALSQYNRPLEIKFDEMLKLMNQCEQVDKLSYAAKYKFRHSKEEGYERSSSSRGAGNGSELDNNEGAGDGQSSLSSSSSSSANQDGVSLKLAANIFPRSPFSLLSGIIPGKLMYFTMYLLALSD